MKSIMLSIKPQWVEKIFNGEKTIEIRKTMPKCELPIKVYIYCTKSKKNNNSWHNGDTLIINPNNENRVEYANFTYDEHIILNGKVVGYFILNKVDLLVDVGAGIHYADKNYNLLDTNDLLNQSCLTEEQIYDYLGKRKDNNGFYNDGYAWHIDDLKIYDTPKELSEFYTLQKCNSCKITGYETSACSYDDTCKVPVILTRPPQSWCYVEKLEENNE